MNRRERGEKEEDSKWKQKNVKYKKIKTAEDVRRHVRLGKPCAVKGVGPCS